MKMDKTELLIMGIVLFFLVGVAVVALMGCNGIGNRTVTTTTTQTVIYQGEQPLMVLDWNGIRYIAVGEASNELLIERGLVRLESGEVVKQL